MKNIGTWHTLFDGCIALTPQAARILGWPEGQPLEGETSLRPLHQADFFADMARRGVRLATCAEVLQ